LIEPSGLVTMPNMFLSYLLSSINFPFLSFRFYGVEFPLASEFDVPTMGDTRLLRCGRSNLKKCMASDPRIRYVSNLVMSMG
jgi:hypothetical protein